MNYLLIFLAGYGFGNRSSSYLCAFVIAALAGMVQPARDFAAFMASPKWSQVATTRDAGENLSLEAKANHYARRHGVEPALFRALVTQESAWNPSAVSPAGAAGLTQLMPETAAGECGLSAQERFDPDKSLDCGAAYLAKQLRRFGSVDLALAAYNSGPERVARLGRVPRIRETQNYVSRITAAWKEG